MFYNAQIASERFFICEQKRKAGTKRRIMTQLCEIQHKLKKVKYAIGAKTGVKWHLVVVANHFLRYHFYTIVFKPDQYFFSKKVFSAEYLF